MLKKLFQEQQQKSPPQKTKIPYILHIFVVIVVECPKQQQSNELS